MAPDTAAGLLTLAAAPAGEAGLPHEFRTGLFYLLLFVVCTLLAAVLGLVSSWIDRKVTARIQARIGPPFLQPFYDFVKLLGKETLIPAGANRMAFLLMPLLALAAVGLAATVLLGNVFWQNGLIGSWGFVGDVVVVLYLLVVPSLALVVGASSSNNPFASVGASRELKLMSYELPMLLAVAAALTLASGAEVRFAREAQRQVDERLGVKSLLASMEYTQRELRAKQEMFRRLDERLRLARTAAVREAKNKKDAVDLRGGIAGRRWLLASGVEPKEAKVLRREIKEKRARLTAIQIELAAAKTVGELERSVQEARERIEEFGRDVGRFREERPLAAKVPLRLSRILTLRRAGPMPDAGLLAASACEKAREARRRSLVKLEALERELTSRKKQLKDKGERGEAADRLAKQLEKFEKKVDDFEWAARALATEEELLKSGNAAVRLDGAALAKAVRGRSADRWASYLVLAVCVLVVLCCAQAKLGLVPFDCAEADTEIAGGVLIEYGGPLLAVWKLVKAMLLFILPVFIGVVFLGGFRFYVPGGTFWEHAGQAAVSLAKYVLILVFFVLVRNTNPRVRVDQAMRFFLGPMTFLAFIALILAVVVHWMSVG